MPHMWLKNILLERVCKIQNGNATEAHCWTLQPHIRVFLSGYFRTDLNYNESAMLLQIIWVTWWSSGVPGPIRRGSYVLAGAPLPQWRTWSGEFILWLCYLVHFMFIIFISMSLTMNEVLLFLRRVLVIFEFSIKNPVVLEKHVLSQRFYVISQTWKNCLLAGSKSWFI